ncbi:MAG: serine protease [Pseudomonadota bacterium]
MIALFAALAAPAGCGQTLQDEAAVSVGDPAIAVPAPDSTRPDFLNDAALLELEGDPVWPSAHGQTKGLNSTAARPEDFRFMAALRGRRDGVITYDCGGSAISANWVLTAAHCVEGAEVGADGTWSRPLSGKIEIVLGVHDLAKVTPDDVYRVSDVRLPDAYGRSPETGDPVHDIALLKLDRSWEGPVVRLSGGRGSDMDRFFGRAVFAGYGQTSVDDASFTVFDTVEGGAQAFSPELLNGMIPTRAPENCADEYEIEGFDAETMICAGYDSGIVDSCKGDSGGPLVGRDFNGRVYQVGIVSYGFSCGVRRSPAVYTRVSGFRRFVSEVAGESVFTETKPELAVSMTKAGLLALVDKLEPARGRATVRLVGPQVNTVDGKIQARDLSDINVDVSTSIDGRLWVFDLDPAGDVTCLFPCDPQAGARSLLAADALIQLPGDADAGYSYQAQIPTPQGDNTLYAFVLPERMALIGDEIPDLGHTKGEAYDVWVEYSDILVYELEEELETGLAVEEAYARMGMASVVYEVR